MYDIYVCGTTIHRMHTCIILPRNLGTGFLKNKNATDSGAASSPPFELGMQEFRVPVAGRYISPEWLSALLSPVRTKDVLIAGKPSRANIPFIMNK